MRTDTTFSELAQLAAGSNSGCPLDVAEQRYAAAARIFLQAAEVAGGCLKVRSALRGRIDGRASSR
jgi:hypothetical protein